MRRLLADLCDSAAFLADLCAAALDATARTVRPAPAADRHPADLRAGGRVRAVIDVEDGRRARAGGYWFR